LHAGVVVNRALEPLESIHWDHTRSTAALRPLGGGHREILEIQSVKGVDAAPPHKATEYKPYASRTAGRDGGFCVLSQATLRTGRVASLIGLGWNETAKQMTAQYLSIDGFCSDGDLPHEILTVKDLSVGGHGLPAGIGVRGLVRPSERHGFPSGVTTRSAIMALAQGHGLGWMEVEIVLRDTSCTPETWDRIGILDAFGAILFSFVTDATDIGSRSRLRVLVEPAGIALDYGIFP
jgi:hypothetical protein